MLIAYFSFPPFVVTLGMLSIARSLAMVLSNNTVVFQFGPDHDKLLALGGGSTFGIANPVLYMIVLALITGFVLRWTRFGRYLFAIGGNEHAATLTGVPVRGDQGRGLHDLGAVGRHRRHRADRLARRGDDQHRRRAWSCR